MFIAPSLFFKKHSGVAPFHANAVVWASGAGAGAGSATLTDSSMGDQAKGLISLWVRNLSFNSGTAKYVFIDTAYSTVCLLEWYDKDATARAEYLRVRLGKGALSRTFNFKLANINQWYHVAISYDFSILEAVTPTQIYVDGVAASFSTATSSAVTVSMADGTGLSLNPFPNSGNASTTEVAELYWDYGHNLDLSVGANIDKLIIGGKPANLGANGSTPTGFQPLIYLPNAAATYGVNAGSIGNFTVTHSFTDASTSPSD